MNRPILTLAAAAALAFATPALAQGQAGKDAMASPAGTAQAVAQIKGLKGEDLGMVKLTQYPAGVLITGDLKGLTPGWHGFHVHETGACEPDFKAAGGHFNPNKTQHGLDGQQMHAGDLANIFVDPDGSSEFQMLSTGFSVGGGGSAGAGGIAAPDALDKDGAAIVIHAQPDDYRTDPSGDSGDRIACGVIKRGQG